MAEFSSKLAQPPSPTACIQEGAVVIPEGAPRAVLVFLHGLTMAPARLFPFAAALSLPVVFHFPYGPVKGYGGLRSWWPVDKAKRKARLAAGPSDLFDRHPNGRVQARTHLQRVLQQVRQRWPGLPVILAGYSQGGMLAMDHLMLGDSPPPDALILLSSTCIALDEWQARLGRGDSPLQRMPVLVMHGRQDDDLALSAGERLRDWLVAAHADVQWKVFEGGHEMPPVVWRGLRRFVLEQVEATPMHAMTLPADGMPFEARWALCCQAAAQADGGPTGPQAGWIAIDRPQPVAAALSALGLFSLDRPDRSFDDEVVWYRAEFDAPASPAAALVFDGLATVADVWLNGEAVLLSCRNMFRQWRLPLHGRVRAVGNQLLLRFDALDLRLREPRPRPRWRVPMVAQQQLRWWRTTLLGRTPGWSPPVAVVGPWLPIWLAPADAPRLSVLRQRAWLEGDVGRYRVEVGAHALPRDARVHLRCAGAEVQAPLVALADSSKAVPDDAACADAGRTRLVAEMSLAQVQRWWPHTHGDPALYEAWIEWTDALGRAHRQALGQIGFRHIRIDTEGGGFSVLVNGEPVFCRGACWTPLDPLRLRAEPAAYDAAIRQLRGAGMNMVRVVGAMAWESPALFDACDRHGVMVWQDLMLANMDYPAEDPEFLEELQAELSQQLRALQARPSLALVCGNSEVEQQAAMFGTAPQSWHGALFHQTLPAWVAQSLPDTAYWPSSASGGDFPHQPGQGTCSYYGVGAYRRALDDARHSGLRFASECLAFANIPSDDALARLPGRAAVGPPQPAWKSRVPRDLGAGWDFDDVRDHYVEHLFGERADALRATDPQRYLALGRAASAEAMQRAFAQWRASDSCSGGALVWFLRDLWPGAGWGLLDDSGEPKAAFHALARVLQPVWLGWVDAGLNGMELHWANEGAEAIDATASVRAWRHGRQPVAQGTQPLHLPPRSRGRIALPALLGGFIDLNWAYRFGPVGAEVLQARLVDVEGRERASALHFPPALLARRDPLGLACRVEAADDGRMQVHLTTQSAALGVHFDVRGWMPSDEYFHMAPGDARTVTLQPRPSVGERALWGGGVTALNTHEFLPL